MRALQRQNNQLQEKVRELESKPTQGGRLRTSVRTSRTQSDPPTRQHLSLTRNSRTMSPSISSHDINGLDSGLSNFVTIFFCCLFVHLFKPLIECGIFLPESGNVP